MVSLFNILFLFGAIVLILFISSAVISIKEHENKAAKRLTLFALIISAPYILISLIEFPGQELTALIFLIFTVAALFILFLPIRKKSKNNDIPTARIDERDIMFSRNELAEGTEKYELYYKHRPENKSVDDEFRAKPGLLNENAFFYEPKSFASAKASFTTIEELRSLAEGEQGEQRIEIGEEEITIFIKSWALKLGAVDVGITELQDYHKYTFVGRGKEYSNPVELNHKYAIAFTVEMDKFMLDSAPHGSIVMESAQQYLESGIIAVQVAQFIRNFGYEARAHIDGNYRVVCPLVARDAGLGEIGRMGLLMTPKLGPRVRISVVTTDLPLNVGKRNEDSTVSDFCSQCNKCATVCPSKSIPFGEKKNINGVERWQVDSESCFSYWCTVGTDCGRCLSVCPYSHPDNLMHNFIRFGIKNSFIFRRLAVKLDDWIYGKRPLPKPPPEWMTRIK